MYPKHAPHIHDKHTELKTAGYLPSTDSLLTFTVFSYLYSHHTSHITVKDNKIHTPTETEKAGSEMKIIYTGIYSTALIILQEH